MLVTVFELPVSNLPLPLKLRSMAGEVYIQSLISTDYTDWLSIFLVITVIHSGKQIGSKLPKSDVIIEIALNPASFLKI